MNDAIVDLENEISKLMSFNQYSNLDTENLKGQITNTLNEGLENFDNFQKDKNDFIKMEIKEKKKILDDLKNTHENLKAQKVEVDKDRGMTSEEINAELKHKRDRLEELEKKNTEKDNQIQKLKSMMFITTEDLRKIMHPKLTKLKTN